MTGLHCAFQGRVGSVDAVRFTQQGKAVLGFSVVVEVNRPGGDGAEATWLRCTAWEDRAQQLEGTLHKGSEVYVEGKLTLRTWQGQDGQQRSGLQCSAWTVQVLGNIGKKAPTAERAA